MATTLDQLVGRVLDTADMASGSFVTPGEVVGYVNSSGGELWDLFQTLYEDWVTTPEYTEFALSGSSYRSALPSDCVKLRGVDMQDGSGWRPVRRYTLEERDRWRASAPSFLGTPERAYAQVGRYISFVPEDNAAGTYRFRYVQAWTPMTGSNDSIDLPNGWDEFIVVDAAIKCLQKEESETRHLEERKAGLLRRIQGAASNRDASEQEFVTDPRSDGWL